MPLLLPLLLCLLGAVALEAQMEPGSSLPPLLPDHTAQVEQALRAEDMPRALREYRAMVAADPKNAQTWTGMGVLLYGSGRAAEAVEALRRALLLAPASPRAELFLALSQADQGACREALPMLQRHFASEPAGKLQRLTGITLLECLTGGEASVNALPVVERLKRMYPGDPDVLYIAATLFTKMWDENANELLTAHPDSYRVHQLAAEVNEAQGKYGQAIRQYQTALAGNAKLPQMHFRIGQLLLKKGDPDADEKAMEQFQAELGSNPRNANAALAMAEIERHRGDMMKAAASYSLALQIEPGLSDARTGRAHTMLAQHQLEAAESEMLTLLAEHPDNAEAHYVLMLVFREQGKLPEAGAEMSTFQRLQHGKSDQFQKRLDALLTGSTADPTSAEGAATTK